MSLSLKSHATQEPELATSDRPSFTASFTQTNSSNLSRLRWPEADLKHGSVVRLSGIEPLNLMKSSYMIKKPSHGNIRRR